ncbi:MAG: ribonuclease H-like domain-containing protein [Anaerolineae bacterium]|nr:ribonuclease H-like domain-containing protein [Anaerolineae bacterium]
MALTLSDKLKALGVQVGARDIAPPQPKPAIDYPIDRVVPGRVTTTPVGETFVVEKRYGIDYRHGRVPLRPETDLEPVAAWAKAPELAEFDLEALAFLDTETTGLAGGSGTYAFMIGAGRFEGDHFRLAQFFMRDPAEEPAQLAALTEFLAPCQALVTFNGKSFDGPLLNTRYITIGEVFPFTDAPHLDLLHLARRLWRDRLPSRALGDLERQVLGLHRTEEDTPGWLIPTLYFNYLRDGDARPLKGTFYHNALDVLAMAALLNHIGQMLADPFGHIIEHALDVVAVGKLFEELGQIDLAIQLFEQGLQANDLPEESYWKTQERLSLAHRKQGNFEAAVAVWQQAAEGRQIYAHVELAKFYEHKQRDYAEAKRWTDQALAIVLAHHPTHAERRRWLTELKHRLKRLERRLS